MGNVPSPMMLHEPTLEACCKAMCHYCGVDWPINEHGDHYDPATSALFWTEKCEARPIRELQKRKR